MKKIFTLLFCAVAIGLAANATDTSLVEQCINVLLENNQSTELRASGDIAIFDANHDGVITIADVTTLIDQILMEEQANKAPAQMIDVEAIAKQVRETQTGEPTIKEVNKAIDHNLKLKE